MANPLIRKYPKRVNKPLPNKSAGILDDHAVRKVLNSVEGTVEKEAINDNDISNKKYVDDAIEARIGAGTVQGQMLYWDTTSVKWLKATGVFWDKVNKRLGIGTDSPDELLVLQGAAAGQRIKSTTDSTMRGLQLENDTTGSIRIHYTRSGGANQRGIINSINELSLRVGGNPGVTIDSSLDVGIGTTSPQAKLHTVGDTRLGDQATNYAEFKADGELELVGTARVHKSHTIALSKMKKGVGNPPADGIKDGFATLDFSPTREEEVFFKFIAPADMDTTQDMSMHLMFFVDTAPASAQGVRWCVEWKTVAAGEAVDFTSGTGTLCETIAVTTGTPANDAILLECEDITGGAGTIAADDLLMCRLCRDATHADDTFTGDARLIKAHVHYTSNKLGEAL